MSAAAQTVQFKVGGGLASHYGSSESVGAYKIGVGYEYEFDQRWTFSPSLIFYGKGWKNPDKLVPIVDLQDQPVYNADGSQKQGVMSVSSTAYYVELPLVFNYYLRTGAARYLVFSAGPYVAYGVGGNVKIKGDTQLSGSERFFYQERTFGVTGTHRWDAGLQAGVGYQLGGGLIVGLAGDFGLLKFSDDGAKNISGLLTLTYKLDFGKP